MNDKITDKRFLVHMEKVRLLKALVWPVAMYGCECWTFRKNGETRLDAFEKKKAEKYSAGFVDSKKKQMSGFLTKLE